VQLPGAVTAEPERFEERLLLAEEFLRDRAPTPIILNPWLESAIT
jgi:hypothetical protein